MRQATRYLGRDFVQGELVSPAQIDSATAERWLRAGLAISVQEQQAEPKQEEEQIKAPPPAVTPTKPPAKRGRKRG